MVFRGLTLYLAGLSAQAFYNGTLRAFYNGTRNAVYNGTLRAFIMACSGLFIEVAQAFYNGTLKAVY
jgi:hypothetical protein